MTLGIGIKPDGQSDHLYVVTFLFGSGEGNLNAVDNNQPGSGSDGSGDIAGTANITGGTGAFEGAAGSFTYNLPGAGKSGVEQLTLTGSGAMLVSAGQLMQAQDQEVSTMEMTIEMLPATQMQQKFIIDSVQTSAYTTVGAPSWVSVSPASGTVQAGTENALTVIVDSTNLSPGVYQGSFSIAWAPVSSQQPALHIPPHTSAPAAQTVHVTAIVSSAPANLTLSQTGLQFLGAAGSPAPPQKSVTISSSGTAAIPFSTQVSTVSGGNWLTVTSGSSQVSAGNPATLSIAADPSHLAPGVYFGEVDVAAPGAGNSPQSIQVAINVLAFTSSNVDVTPRGLVFYGQAGSTPPATQTIRITSTSNSIAGIQLVSDSLWLTATASASTVVADQPVIVTVTANPSGLPAGIYLVGQLAVITSDEIELPVTVEFWVGATPPPSNGAHAVAACVPNTLLPVFTLLGNKFTTQAGLPVPLEAMVLDNCGNAVTAGTVAVTISAYDSKSPPDDSVGMTPVGNGLWDGTWMPRGVNGGPAVATVSAITPAGVGGSASIFGTVTANLGAPTVTNGGVVSAASYAPDSAIAPGSFISIFGTNMATGLKSSPGYPLFTSLGGTQVTLGGEPLPLQFVTGSQINALVPYDAPVNAVQQLTVVQNGVASLPQTVFVAAAQPAVFTQNQSGSGAGVMVVIEADGTEFVATSSAPATAGNALAIYCAGLGAVNPAVPAGTAVPASGLTQTDGTVTVTIGGLPAQVLFSGLTAGFSGLYQVNAVIPATVTPGSAVPVILTVAGISSPPVTIAIQ
jgi:uncharacterized protein (TIGR03437 family)